MIHNQPVDVVKQIDATVKTLPVPYRLSVEFALYRAKNNTPELLKALQESSQEEISSMAFLISAMPGS